VSLSITQYAVVASAGSLSWIAVDLIANMLLKTSKTGVRFRLKFLGARWLRWKQAVVAGFIQFGIAFVASYFIQDYFIDLFSQNTAYLFPISLSALSFIYAYIFGLTPYKKTLRRFSPSIVLIIIAILFFIAIWHFTQYPFKF
jgi:hypothetical protein